MVHVLLQAGETDLGKVPVGGDWLFWSLLVVIVALLAAAAFYFGRVWGGFMAGRAHAADKERMFSIEKSLQDYYASDKKRFEEETAALRQKVELLEKKNDEYKRKAAGVGVMGMGKDRKAELMLELMAENEALEEKLFEQNLKLKQERDEHLARELQHVSVKRVLLSEVLRDSSVRASIQNVLADESRLKRVSLDRLPEPAEKIVEGTAKVVEPAAAPEATSKDAETGTPAGQAPPA